MTRRDRTQPPLAGPVREHCGQPTRWGVQGSVTRTIEIPPNNPPTFFAAGPWECTVEAGHRGPWVHTTTDPGEYLAREMQRRGL